MTRHSLSAQKVTESIGGGIDEWFHPKGISIVEACEYTLIRRDRTPGIPVRIDMVDSLFGAGYDLGKVSIDPEECVHLLMRYTLTMPEHGLEILTYRFPINRPEVILECPPSLRARIVFSHREKYDIPSNLSSSSFTLERVLLPHQDIKVYWHRTEDVQLGLTDWAST